MNCITSEFSSELSLTAVACFIANFVIVRAISYWCGGSLGDPTLDVNIYRIKGGGVDSISIYFLVVSFYSSC